MDIDDPMIVALRKQVTAAQQEFDMAVAFHEVWKPATYDKELHSRLGKSYASQAFLVARTALRCEMLLALMRLWDSTRYGEHIRMQSVWATLRKREVIDALALDRANCMGWHDVVDGVRDDLGKKAGAALLLLDRYMEGGKRRTVLKRLLALRHERLAHRQLSPAAATATGANATDEEIEEFYLDNSKLIAILLSLVNATAYDPQDTAKVFSFYASHFWKRVT
jgi:AbiU2